ncbi:hypothetical protein EMIHUDRAFT_451794 [Emiliania huxleyi CCMP1516]|uniref:Uncharacterized protein n=2 Tax=Emiliania huxleyi TaxID=2903 RepID=A0A0D3ISX6_EMIH1|nr:hypothetical protein EMIHUDRAFT_451794 [Emiliania huxleyi CCMP1516]EOD14361.1 hypothetical protein EMIHUDRAFT_451794 [Emiliania huxleyi CCMP1516]|eukprot:XP_005766790.1 hypothetical protein EMIHUDRAFT_451794 [Emiliania huxleyi CCMP1516]
MSLPTARAVECTELKFFIFCVALHLIVPHPTVALLAFPFADAAARVAALESELEATLEAAVRREALNAQTIKREALNGAGALEARELRSRVDVLYQENDVLTAQARLSADELERLRQERAGGVEDQMRLVGEVGELRAHVAAVEAAAARAAASRDAAREELQRCGAELLEAQEHTQTALAIAERHANERDDALRTAAELRAALERVRGKEEAERRALAARAETAEAAAAAQQQAARALKLEMSAAKEREQAALHALHDSRADAAAGGNAIRSLEARALHAEGQAARALHAEGQAASAAAALSKCESELAVAQGGREALEARAARAEARAETLQSAQRAAAEEERVRVAQLSASLRREAGARSTSLREELESAELRCAELQQRLERAQSRDGGRFGGKYMRSLQGGAGGASDGAAHGVEREAASSSL